ncbi:MAG: flagellar motor protein MotB [Acidobacteriota bacterium]|nr:flagellar motor protein MotB [Acidobacteriota bacterium]
MRRRRKHEDNHDRWMVSYADFLTLLFAFFVVLYSTSQVDKKRMAQLSTAITAGFSALGAGNGAGGNVVLVPRSDTMPPQMFTTLPINPIRTRLETGLSEEIEKRTVSIREIPEGLVLSLHEVGFFDSGSASLQSNSLETFDRIGAVVNAYPCNLRIEGHTDNVPIHNSQFHSNWELSTARASEIIRILVTREHVEPDRLSAAGYGEYHPVASNGTDEGRRTNRRVDIVIVNSQPGAPKTPIPGIKELPSAAD